MNKKGLGKGLDAFFSNNQSKDNIHNIPIKQIIPNPKQPRKHFDENSLKSLAETIKKEGILTPIIVVKDNNKYVIVAGERRYRAAKLANLQSIPCIIRNLTENDVILYSLIENIQREDLNPIDRANALLNFIKKTGYTHEKIGKLLGLSRVYVTNTLRLLKLPKIIQGFIIEGKLSEGHGRILASLSDKEAIKIAKLCIDKNLSVRQLESLLKTQKKVQKIKKKSIDPNIMSIEKQLQNILSREVKIKSNKKYAGEIKLKFYNLDDLNNLIDILKKIKH